MSDAGWKSSESLPDIEHDDRTMDHAIRVSCARFITRIVYILSTIGLLHIVRK